MSENEIPNFLGEQSVKMPVGGEFSPRGFIGLFRAAHLYRFYAQGAEEAVAVEAGVGPALEEFGWFYYLTHEDAEQCIKTLDIQSEYKVRPQHCWRIEAQSSSIIDLPSPESWGDTVAGTVDIKTLQSVKRRHGFQLITLPLAVTAYANLLGIDNPGFDISELTEPDQAFTDELFAHLCGDPDVRGLKGLYDAELFKRRAALWAALGEDDPLRNVAYSGEGKKSKYQTDAPNLVKCLGIIEKVWTAPVWARMMFVPDPKPDALSKSGNRTSVPGLIELFCDEEDAKAAAEKDKADRENENGEGSSSAKVPSVYADYPEVFHQELESFKAANPNYAATPEPVLKSALAGHPSFDQCVDEALAWLKQ